ncbi:hypothetical protein H671_1g4062 [Cricetulus griseus]|nr:hypothetical protein H671_1g4062 [Cricetulus griseus]
MEKTQVQNVVDKLRQETKKVLGKWILLQHYLGEMKGICEEEEQVIRDLQTQEQQEQQRLEENRQSQRKDRELAIQKKNIAGKLQHYLAGSLMRRRETLDTIKDDQDSSRKEKPLEEKRSGLV